MTTPKTLRSRERSLIDHDRIEEIGGLENPDIRRILDSFTRDLTGYLYLMDQQRAEENAVALLATLHKLAGASRTCGFSGISRVVDAWMASPKLLSSNFHTDLQSTIEASIAEWRCLVP